MKGNKKDKDNKNGIKNEKNADYQIVDNKKANGTINKDDSMSDVEMVPPDGGWGWFVLFAAVVVNVLIPGGIKSFGVLYANFLETFEASNAAGSWIPALCYFLYSSLGPLSSILSEKYSYRTVTLVGGTFAATGMMLSYFTNSVTYLYFSYGIMVGIGAGLSFPPTVYIVTSYFVRLRGLANGLCISGSSLGSILLPRFISTLLDIYSFRGTVLIMGGITLNVWACALLYDPVEKHLIPKKKNSETEEPMIEVEIAVTSPDDDSKTKSPLLPSSNGSYKPVMITSNVVPKSASSVALENYQHKNPTPIQYRTRKISVPVGGNANNYNTASQMHSTPALHAVPERGSTRSRKLTPLTPLSPSNSSFNFIHTPYHGSTLSIINPQYASSLTLNALSSTFRKSPEKRPKQTASNTDQGQEQSMANKFFDIELLKDPMYLVILISNCTNAISYTNFVIVLQQYVNEIGYKSYDRGLMLTIISFFDLTGRIGGAALSDTRLMPKHFYFVGGLLISGISLTALPLAESYVALAAYCGVFGLASGVYVGVTAVVMADMLGVEKLTSSYGISLFVNGVIQLIGPPIVGWTYERTHNFGPIFSALGVVLISGALLWGCVPSIRRKQAAEKARKLQSAVA